MRRNAPSSILLLVLTVASCRTVAPTPGMPANFGVVKERAIYRGAQPSRGDLAALKGLGIKTILKLNAKGLEEERSEAAALGLRLIEVPLNARTVGNAATCREVGRAYAAMTDPSNWPIFVHCSRGRDRTGFLAGLFRERVSGWSYEQVRKELSLYGHDSLMETVFPNISRALSDNDRECAQVPPAAP